MAAPPLTRRKAQLELLAQACQKSHRARVVLAGRASPGPATNTRFLALEPDGVLLQWPADGLNDIPASGATVEVFFEHAGQRYGFRTQTRDRVWRACDREEEGTAWKLALPLRVEYRQQRQHFRVSLADLGPIPADCTSVANEQHSFAGELQSISPGGLRVSAARTDAGALGAGELLWTEFELPGQTGPFEFVVRVAHATLNEESNRVVFGCMFCPGEDCTSHHAQLDRIERFVAQRERARLRRANRRDAGGL
jgi:c-di-GMP-binding flagellar brake protein YcgR